MKRRELIAAATAALLVSPRRSWAQGAPRRIGFLGAWADEPARDPAHAAWLSGLREKGWIEGKNLVVDTSGALDMFEVVIPPNSRMPVPHHHRDWEETIYGLEGVVTWTVAGKRIEIKPGDDLFIPRGVVHGFVNEMQAIAKMLCVLTPGVLGPEFFREMAVAIGGPVPPDPARMGEIMKRHGLIPAPS
jgi:quercetin dioxygenase-like cupin family protein